MGTQQAELFAPLHFPGGAPVAQKSAPLLPGTLKGNGAGAKLRHTTAPSGAMVARHSPNQVPERVARIKETLRELAVERSILQPSADAYTSALKAARARRQDSHAEHPVNCSSAVRCERIMQHDRILAASTKWGRQARLYREINATITGFAKELEALTEKGPTA